MKEGEDSDHLHKNREGGVSQDSCHWWRQAQREEHGDVVEPAQEVDRLLGKDQFVYHRLVPLDHCEVVNHTQAHVGAQHKHQNCVEKIISWDKSQCVLVSVWKLPNSMMRNVFTLLGRCNSSIWSSLVTLSM